mgnify:CR=1 FL=1|jgi:hypothetical protein
MQPTLNFVTRQFSLGKEAPGWTFAPFDRAFHYSLSIGLAQDKYVNK